MILRMILMDDLKSATESRNDPGGGSAQIESATIFRIILGGNHLSRHVIGK